MQSIRLYHYPMKAVSINNHHPESIAPITTSSPDSVNQENQILGQQIIDRFQEILPSGYLLLKLRKDGKFLHAGKSTFLDYPIKKWMDESPYLSTWLADKKTTPKKAQRIWLSYIENTQKPIRIWFHYPNSTLSPAPVEIHRHFWEEEKKEDSVLLLVRDLRDEHELRVKARREQRKSNEILRKQREDFSAHLHDWKVPLSVIESSIWLCQRYNKDGQAEKRANHLKRIETALNELKTDFQNWELWNNPKSSDDKRCIKIRAFMEERIEMLSSSLKKGQTISFWHQGVESMHTDPYAIRHILDNLISNAIKYSPQNTEIKIKIWAYDKKVRFEIIDQGIGIPKEDIPHLLKPRFRAGNSHGIPGNGLGLSNVEKLIKRLDGLLEIQSTINQGSTFILTIQNKT